ncbi:MAG: DNA topoisomerase [Desulfurivibrionaceae bacterium]|nr:DNA topoisomerase [Desulfurivibrionaceae bacterium]
MGQRYILVETAEKRETLAAVWPPGKGEVLLVPALAAVVETKNVEYLARGEAGFLFRPVTASQAALQKLLHDNGADIYLAFDRSDRGEYSSWLWTGLVAQLSKGALYCRRLHLAALTEEGMERALALVEPVDAGRAAALYFAHCFEGLLATHLQRLLGTHTGPGGLPLTMPVLAILALLWERQQEIKAFAGTPTWQVRLSLQGPDGEFGVGLKEVFGINCDGIMTGRKQAGEVARDLAGQYFSVVSRQEKDLDIAAPLPYTFSELIFDAHCQPRISVAEAMAAATSLATGVLVGGKRQALISSLYPLVLTHEQSLVEGLQQEVTQRFGREALQGRPLAAHGILPLDPQRPPEALADLSPACQQVYDLVWRRALASQMSAARGKEVTLGLVNDTYRLQSDFQVIAEPGFRQVYDQGFGDLVGPQVAASLQEGDEARVAQVVPEQRWEGAPQWYTLPALAADLAELGMTDEEEVVQLVGRLVAADYIKDQGKGALQDSANLGKVVQTLNRAFPAMAGLNFVVYYGQTLAEVVSGRKRLAMALKQFDQNMFMQGRPLVKIKMPDAMLQRTSTSKNIIKGGGLPRRPQKKAAPAGKEPPFTDFVEPEVPESDQEAPSIEETTPPAPSLTETKPEAPAAGPGLTEELPPGGADVEEQAGTGSLAGEAVVPAGEDEGAEGPAPVFPETALPDPAEKESVPKEPAAAAEPPKPLRERAQVATRPCPQCGRAMVAKHDRFGTYWACIGAPACRHTEGGAEEDEAETLLCPLCSQGRLLVKKTPTGKDMYLCSDKECDFMAWSRPHPLPCPLCTSPYLVEKKGDQGQIMLRCPKAGCTYCRGVEGSEEGPEAPEARKKVVVRRLKGSGSGGGRRKVMVRRKK